MLLSQGPFLKQDFLPSFLPGPPHLYIVRQISCSTHTQTQSQMHGGQAHTSFQMRSGCSDPGGRGGAEEKAAFDLAGASCWVTWSLRASSTKVVVVVFPKTLVRAHRQRERVVITRKAVFSPGMLSLIHTLARSDQYARNVSLALFNLPQH